MGRATIQPGINEFTENRIAPHWHRIFCSVVFPSIGAQTHDRRRLCRRTLQYSTYVDDNLPSRTARGHAVCPEPWEIHRGALPVEDLACSSPIW